MTPTARRRAVLTVAALLGGTTAAWANFTASPSTITINCPNGSSGSASFTITNNASGSNTLTISSIGQCPGYSITPNPHTFPGSGSATFMVSVSDPTAAMCTFQMDGSYTPEPIPLPTFGVTTTNCGGGSGMLTVTPPSITFPPTQAGSISTQPFFVTNNTFGPIDSLEYSVGPGPFQLDCMSTSCTRDFFPPLQNGLAVTPDPWVTCSSLTPGTYMGTITVTADGGMFTKMIDLTCQVTAAGSGPQISVPDMVTVAPVSAAGTQSSMAMFAIQNTGTGTGSTLVVSGIAESGAFESEWTIAGCMPSCSIPSMQAAMVIVVLDPAGIGDRPISLEISSNDMNPPSDQTKVVQLHGIGLGALITATPPSDTTLDFGQQATGSPSSPYSIELVNSGNADLVVTPDLVGADFIVMPAAATTVTAGGGPVQFQVACNPQSVGPVTGTLSIAAPDNMIAPTQFDYPLECEGFAATLEVVPPSLAFGSLRVEAPGQTLWLSITNQTGAAVPVGPLTVDNPSYTLAGFAVESTMMLGDGMTENVMVTFDPATEALQVGDIAGIEPMRLYRVTGTGTVPRYQAVPSEHDFGRVCVGDPVTQDFTLAIMPSSDILVDGVALDGDAGYMMALVDPMGYPVSLAPTQHAEVSVTVVAREGRMDGTLTWTTDVAAPASRVVPLQLEGIADGLSVTPVAVDFGPVALGAISAEMRPTLKSCGSDSFEVTADLVDNDDAAFLLSGPEQATITASATMPWGVTFAPDTAGRFEATLRLTPSAGEPVDIALVGGGQIDGVDPPGETSYYACGCAGGAGGVIPGLVALALITARRRRGSS